MRELVKRDPHLRPFFKKGRRYGAPMRTPLLTSVALVLIIATLSGCMMGEKKKKPGTQAIITLSPGAVLPGDPLTATINFTTDVTGFDASDITVAGGTAGAFTVINPAQYTLALTAGAAGSTTIDVSFPRGACQDPKGKSVAAASGLAAIGYATWGTASSDANGVYADLSITTGFGSATQRFRLIPAGKFLMGSPRTEPGREPETEHSETQHEVTLTTPYWIADSECTQQQWQVVTNSNPSYFTAGGLSLPVEQVSWNQVQTFIATLNAAVPGVGVRLPTEAEWEYAARAGTTTPFSLVTVSTATINCWVDPLDPYIATGTTQGQTSLVKSLTANPWGLHDVHGNVWEWCSDRYEINLGKSADTDPTGPTSGVTRVLKGGSWGDYGRLNRSAARRQGSQTTTSGGIGFRLVIPIEPSAGG